MASLTLLYLGSHQNLSKVPAFKGLSSLETLVLESLSALQELPAFDSTKKLTQLQLTSLPGLTALPDLAPVAESLFDFKLVGRAPVCCNGFLNGTCDLSASYCTADPEQQLSAATCTSLRATDATRGLGERFAASVCSQASWNVTSNASIVIEDSKLTRESAELCNGTMYRACTLTGDRQGMCYNPRMQAIYCDTSTLAIEMRRRQIAQGIGDACDPEVEAWLGCA